MRPLLESAAERAIRYLEDVKERRVGPSAESICGLKALEESFPAGPADQAEVLRVLDEIGSPATMAMAGPRFFGWVIGGSLPAALAANWLAAAEAHPSLIKSLGMLGMGRNRVVRVPVDGQGRMRVDALPALRLPAIVCVQAGNVNTGAFDPAADIIPAARGAGAWVHVDGAFGLWAAASPRYRHLVDGFAGADSWATDAHKWLNVPYDSGLAFVRSPADLRAAMGLTAAYLPQGEHREPSQYVPELSRRARGVEIWAALKSLGRGGLAALVERCCACAKRFADGLSAMGFEVLNDVVLNQVLVSFGTPAETERVIAGIQEDGTCWCGGTVWQGRTAMRISVSSWATTEADVDRSLEAMGRAARAASARA
jgi:glutamate/tyrosine decarboxylase-like PLP-dependent enzyme